MDPILRGQIQQHVDYLREVMVEFRKLSKLSWERTDNAEALGTDPRIIEALKLSAYSSEVEMDSINVKLDYLESRLDNS